MTVLVPKPMQEQVGCGAGLEPIDPTSAGADDSGLTDPRHKLQIPVSHRPRTGDSCCVIW